VDYTSWKEKLIQSWSCTTLAVIKRRKYHLSLSLITSIQLRNTLSS